MGMYCLLEKELFCMKSNSLFQLGWNKTEFYGEELTGNQIRKNSNSLGLMPVEKMVRGGIEPGITYCNSKSLI